MRMPDVQHDPPRDPELGAMLRSLDDDGGALRLTALRASIRARAVLPLAARATRPGWMDVAARWSRPALPLTAAAGVLLAVLVGSLPTPPSATAGDLAMAELPYLEDALSGDITEVEYRLLTGSAAGDDALLQFAVQEY
jgi:hypothetical protein